MVIIERAADLAAYVGTVLGMSAPVEVTQQAVSQFGALSGDENWFHVDPERAARDMPNGRTIAHGLYILSLAPALQKQIFSIQQRGRGLNYGYDRVRFVRPIHVGAHIRMIQRLIAVTPHAQGTKIESDQSFEVEGETGPALIARNILLVLDR
jgi:acyl dehydratase